MTIQIICNGEPRQVPPETSVAELVRQLGIAERKFAVELNRKVVSRDRLATVTLTEGDEVNIVTLVGGG
jgi:thiamine biosynthesis protein ThiS